MLGAGLRRRHAEADGPHGQHDLGDLAGEHGRGVGVEAELGTAGVAQVDLRVGIELGGGPADEGVDLVAVGGGLADDGAADEPAGPEDEQHHNHLV